MKRVEITPRSNAPQSVGVYRESPSLSLARRVLIASLVVASVAGVLYFVWYAASLLLLIFAGVLVSVLLRGFSRFLREKTGMGRGLSLGIVVLGLAVLIALAAWLITGRIGSQWSVLEAQLPLAVESLARYVGQYEWAREAVSRLPNLDDWLAARSRTIVSNVAGLASTTLGVILNVVIVLVIAIYLASQPEMYSDGVKHMLPFRFRERAGEVLGVLDGALWRWLVGRFGTMIINGGLTALGLWLLGMPLALVLGLLAGLLDFIPNFGPWIAAVPAVLIAFTQSPQQALYVALLYLVVQSLDGYVITPLVDRRSVELPPVLTITAQVLLGAAFGFTGLLLASPLTAVVMIVVKMLYVEDVIGDPIMEESGVVSDEVTEQADGKQT